MCNYQIILTIYLQRYESCKKCATPRKVLFEAGGKYLSTRQNSQSLSYISKVVPSVLYRWKKLPYLLVVSNVTLCASCGISLNVVRINKITCNCMYKRQKMAFEMLISPFFCDLLFLPSYCRQR